MASRTSSSASTALVSTRGGNDDGQEGVEEVKASPFDNLPDEVVLLILDAVFDNLSLHTTLLDLVVDHRVFSLAKEVWFSSLQPDDDSLPHLFLRQDLHHLVRTLRYVPTGAYTSFQYEMLSLTPFANITSLTLTGSVDEDGDEVDLSKPVSDCLSIFQQLEILVLDFDHPFSFEDTTFNVGRCLPRLRSLTLGSQCLCYRQLLDRPCPKLERLSLTYNEQDEDDDIYPVIPWSTLTSLSIYLPTKAGDFCPQQRFLKSLDDALLPPIYENPSSETTVRTLPSLPLRSLALRHQIFEAPPSSDADEEDESRHSGVHLDHLFRLLSCSSIEHLCIRPQVLSHIPENLPSLISVMSLTVVEDSLDLSAVKELFGLHKLISRFPSLRILGLEGVKFAPEVDADERQLYSPDSLDFLLRHATLPALILALTQSTVLSFTWFANPETYCWSRMSATEQFEVERWRPY